MKRIEQVMDAVAETVYEQRGYNRGSDTLIAAIGERVRARLTEPDAGEVLEPDGTPTRDVWPGAGGRLAAAMFEVDAEVGGEGTERSERLWDEMYPKSGPAMRRAAPDTTEATLDHIAWAQAIRLKHEATHGEAEQCGAECVVLGLTEFEEGTERHCICQVGGYTDICPIHPDPDAGEGTERRSFAPGVEPYDPLEWQAPGYEGMFRHQHGDGRWCWRKDRRKGDRREPDAGEGTHEHDAERCFGCAEVHERALAEQDAIARTPDTTEATLRAAGEGYEVRVWQKHEPSGVVVLPGHPQLGGRYCQTDGGDWPCATVRAALQQPRS